ncbi:amino acid ABC transporter permease [Herbaspirillum sp. C7C8]|uniref:amino acid ABC transporter permease n=1 Tax=Herbaspirillum sp. C7C8 TaxID=2736665 RepID=UPI001F520858|nr:amino acid ABC transporter permease [Herbaspirillum sp. C7C8]MCI1003600.1 amino acid ABC transporter permease [Herbaspirillum sp. C7C8]
MHYNWNWGIFWEMSPDGIPYIDTLLAGLKWTLATAACAWIMALVLGTIFGTLRTTTKPWVVRIANGYVELFRNIPLLVQMFLWYFVIPELLPKALGDWIKSLPDASFVTATLALGFFTSSRVAVQVTTGIQALPRGQRMAGTALGLTPTQTYRYVLLPMAFRIIIPALTNEFAAIIKNSSVALTIGLVELTAATYSMREFTFQTFEALTGATIIYVIISVIALFLARLLEKVTAVPGYITGGSTSAGGH